MLNGFYSAASAMLMHERHIAMVSNNMANAKTYGYKSEQLIAQSFNDVLMGRQQGDSITPIGYGSPLQTASIVDYSFDASALEETGVPFNFAIAGDGFFQIETANGMQYTRNGNFALDDNGNLVLPGIGNVMGQFGVIPLEDSAFTVLENGDIYNSASEYVDTMVVAMPNDYASFKKIENGMLVNEDAAGMQQVTSNIQQGQLERSNVDFASQVTKMMEIMRNFQSVSNIIKSIDQINAKSASEVGRL